MDSGPGACAPSRNDDPLDVSGFMESMVWMLKFCTTSILATDAHARLSTPVQQPHRPAIVYEVTHNQSRHHEESHRPYRYACCAHSFLPHLHANLMANPSIAQRAKSLNPPQYAPNSPVGQGFKTE